MDLTLVVGIGGLGIRFAVGPRAFNNKRKVSPRVCDDVYEMAADSRSLVLRAKTSLMGHIKAKLSPDRIGIFSETCFGSWLELTETTADPIMLYTLLDRQVTSDDLPVDDMYFQVGDHRLRFSQEEFCLVTGLRFGEEPDDFPASSGFLSRTFGDGATIKLEHVLGVYDTIGGPDDDMSDLDAVRVCLMVVVDLFFLGRSKKMKVSPVVLGAIENLDFWNSYPWGVPIWRYTFKQMYNCLKSGTRTEETQQFTLSGFLFALKTWILETFPYSNKYFIKRDNLYPRGVRWTRRQKGLTREHVLEIIDMSRRSRRPRSLLPEPTELAAEWYVQSMNYLRVGEEEEAPHAQGYQQPPQQDPYAGYWARLETVEESQGRMQNETTVGFVHAHTIPPPSLSETAWPRQLLHLDHSLE